MLAIEIALFMTAGSGSHFWRKCDQYKKTSVNYRLSPCLYL